MRRGTAKLDWNQQGPKTVWGKVRQPGRYPGHRDEQYRRDGSRNLPDRSPLPGGRRPGQRRHYPEPAGNNKWQYQPERLVVRGDGSGAVEADAIYAK